MLFMSPLFNQAAFNAERYSRVIQYGISHPDKLFENCIVVRDKANNIVPLILNKAQKKVMEAVLRQLREQGMVRLVVLKSRQQGITTLCNAILLWRLLAYPNSSALIMSHSQDSMEQNFFRNLIRMAEGVASNLFLSMGKPTAKSFTLATGRVEGKWANTKGGGRGSTFSFAHMTEIDEYNNFDETLQTVLPCIPDSENTCVIFESTSKGLDGNLHNFYKRNGRYEFIFLPWYDQDEYVLPSEFPPSLTEEQKRIQAQYNLTDEQMNWYAQKEEELGSHIKMQHEYPCCIEDCFAFSDDDTYVFDFALLDRALRTQKNPTPRGRLILGIDPARVNDNVAMVWRRGTNIEKIVYFKPPCGDDSLLWDRVVFEIRNFYPDDIYVDVGGIGGNVPYILRSLGIHSCIHEVYFNQSPDNKQAYYDKRAEMYFNARTWLKNGACIPSDELFMSELRAIKYIPDSQKFRIVEKSEIKKHLKHSPDIADAFALTFPYIELAACPFSGPSRYVSSNTIFSKE